MEMTLSTNPHNAVPRGADQYPLRLPEGLRARLKASAIANRRSMNSEIIVLLERALPPEETKPPETSDSRIPQ